MKYIKFDFFLIYFYLIINVFAAQILKRDDTIKTDNNYVVFDSSEFAIGDEMHFELDAKSWCSEYLDYQYFDSIDSIDYSSELNYYIEKEASSSTRVNGVITSYTLYFTIKKTEDELDGLKGNYLLLKYECDKNSVEFGNTKKSGKSKIATIVIVVIVVFIVVFVGIFLVIYFCRKRRSIPGVIYEGQENYPYPYPYQVNPYYPGQVIQPQYQNGNVAIIYPNQNMVINAPNNANYNYGVTPQNVPIVQNGATPSSNRDNYLQKYEKPKA